MPRGYATDSELHKVIVEGVKRNVFVEVPDGAVACGRNGERVLRAQWALARPWR